MKRLPPILIFLFSFLCPLAGLAQYSVFDFGGQVKVLRSGQAIAAAKGMALKAPDYIEIGKDSWVQIHTVMGSKLYRSEECGTHKLLDLLHDAENSAKSHRKNLIDGMALGARRDKGNPVYVETGVVTRSLATYDPSAENRTVDPTLMAQALVNAMKAPVSAGKESCPAALTSSRSDDRLTFAMENTLEFPIYFNVLKADSSGKLTVDVSVLGQPSGNYVLLPGHTISRSGDSPEADGCTTLVIVTHYFFDLDAVLDKVSEIVDGAMAVVVPDDFPISISRI